MFNSALFESSLLHAVSERCVSERLSEAVCYYLFPAGKRIRPKLLLAFSEDLQIEPSTVMPFALALELLHAASLIHDNHPSLDNDDQRRGRPSCHKAFGDGIALLAGDCLIAIAFQCCLRQPFPSNFNSPTEYLAQAFFRLCDGQALDILNSDTPATTIASLKTGALFAACLAIPAMIHSASSEVVSLVEQCGTEMGVLFQARDDLLDARGTFVELGREPGGDVRRGRTTFVSEYSLQALERSVQSYQRRALALLESIETKSGITLTMTRSTLRELSLI